MSNWLIRAYKRYNDIDKFIIIIYLIHKNLIFYRKNGLVIDYETFYKERTLEIEKINISDISNDLKIFWLEFVPLFSSKCCVNI